MCAFFFFRNLVDHTHEMQNESEYDQEITQSLTADKPMVP